MTAPPDDQALRYAEKFLNFSDALLNQNNQTKQLEGLPMYNIYRILPVLLGCCTVAVSQANASPKLGIPDGQAMVCQLDRQEIERKGKKTKKQVDYYSVISSKSAQLCDGEGKTDQDEMSCKRFELVGKNDGDSIIYVSDDGYKLTTNYLALAFGAGVSVENLKETYSTAYTGRCHSADVSTIKKWMPQYAE